VSSSPSASGNSWVAPLEEQLPTEFHGNPFNRQADRPKLSRAHSLLSSETIA